MRERILQKMKDCAVEWAAQKRNHDLVKLERGDKPMKGYNLNPLNPLPDFHDYFFDRFEKEFSVFDKHTRRYVFHNIYTNIEFWEASGLCCWDKFRLHLTEEGLAAFVAKAE